MDFFQPISAQPEDIVRTRTISSNASRRYIKKQLHKYSEKNWVEKISWQKFIYSSERVIL